MLFEPNRTQFDLHFRLFGVHVRVHPLFWLICAMLNWGLVGIGFKYLILWIFCVFISILLHELGHVFMGRLFGADGHIVLFSFGGLAIGSAELRNRWQRIAVYCAGPGIQFILYGLLLALRPLVARPFAPEGLWELSIASLVFLLEINLYWPILNLLPVWPLDGGRISRELFAWISPARGTVLSLWVSLGVSCLLAVYSLAGEHLDSRFVPDFLPRGSTYTALLFAMFALQSYFDIMQQRASQRRWDEQHRNSWDKNDGDWR